ncbi:MAG: NAD(P)-dependent oxidoreductase [Alicyclobacillus sp. RIFOXYA1_FULL_53_8]|nr:MAG: NAD(P)-dependent oxidoreductase [Alicyclobacillus sp. RIFOXYA1_FULL_53_8]
MSLRGDGKIAVVTGASSGIGQASAIELAKAGFTLAIGARRTERLEATAAEIERVSGVAPFVHSLDVTSVESSQTFVDAVMDHFGGVHVLLNNAGLALGSTYIENADSEDDWQTMMDTNVIGLLRMTRLLIPKLLESGGGHIVNLGSIAGRDAYAGGAGYCASKFAVRAITDTLRQELLGKPIHVTTIDPGMVETEFSIVRNYGDEVKAKDIYAGMEPLTAADIADLVVFSVTRPWHVNIDAIIVKPLAQAGAGKVARRQPE